MARQNSRDVPPNEAAYQKGTIGFKDRAELLAMLYFVFAPY